MKASVSGIGMDYTGQTLSEEVLQFLQRSCADFSDGAGRSFLFCTRRWTHGEGHSLLRNMVDYHNESVKPMYVALHRINSNSSKKSKKDLQSGFKVCFDTSKRCSRHPIRASIFLIGLKI